MFGGFRRGTWLVVLVGFGCVFAVAGVYGSLPDLGWVDCCDAVVLGFGWWAFVVVLGVDVFVVAVSDVTFNCFGLLAVLWFLDLHVYLRISERGVLSFACCFCGLCLWSLVCIW